MYDICIVAHVTKDVNTTPSGVKELTGGAAYYLGMALKCLQANFLLATKLSPDHHPLLDELEGVPMRKIVANQSHFFENIYEDLSDNRQQKVHSLAEPFQSSDVSGIQAKVFHFGPLSSQDVPIELMRELKQHGQVSLDAQGFLREVINEEVHPNTWPEMEAGLPLVDILKVNDFEAQILTGEEDMKSAAYLLADYGISEVVITMGSRNSLILSNNELIEIPAYPPKQIIDATGCGDTYMAGYLYQRTKGATIETAGRFGAALATLKMEDFGPFRGKEGEVIALLEQS